MMNTASIPPAIARLCGDELRSRFPKLRHAIGHAQREAAREHAHALRGMASNFGLARLASALAGLESAARDGTGPLDRPLAAVELEMAPALAALGCADIS